MSDVTKLLNAVGHGDSEAARALFPIVYQELRTLARARMARERREHTLQATALVHEAYLRLVGNGSAQWENRGHFLAAAAEAMRRILVDHARVKQAEKRGGGRLNVPLDDALALALPSFAGEDILALDEALSRLERRNAELAKLVKLLFFAELSLDEAADVLKISRSTASRQWVFARAWLFSAIVGNADESQRTPSAHKAEGS